MAAACTTGQKEPLAGRSAVEHPGSVGMSHQREGLTLGFETG
jgi:hypothetical protein